MVERSAPSMGQRVLRAGVWSAAAGGAFSAVITILALDALVRDHTDQRLRAATVTLAGELDEDRGETKQESLDDTLDDENDEIVTSGIRLAVYEAGVAIAGDDWAPLTEDGECETFGLVGHRIRSCARQYERWVLVAAQLSDQRALRWLFALAALGAIVVSGGIGALFSRRLSRWAVAPLEDLTRRVQSSDPRKQGSTELELDGDCAEVNAIARALAELLQQVQVLLEQTRRLAADASHELRTPLAALCVELELLIEQLPDLRAQSRVQAALARAQQLGVLVERLLLLAAPVDQLRGGFEAVSLSDLAHEVVHEMNEGDRARMRVVAEHEGLVRGDVALLRVLIRNALSNALKYSNAEVGLRIDDTAGANRDIDAVGAVNPSHFVELWVQDHGPGIAPALRKRVFEPFYRALPGNAVGHGLGLALVAHIANAHGGEAQFMDCNEGALLRVRLPAWSRASSLEVVEQRRGVL